MIIFLSKRKISVTSLFTLSKYTIIIIINYITILDRVKVITPSIKNTRNYNYTKAFI